MSKTSFILLADLIASLGFEEKMCNVIEHVYLILWVA